LLIHPKIINLTHKGKANDKVKTMCLVLVKMYGNSPRKLLNIIIENKEIKINVLPFILLILRSTENSLCKVSVIFNHNICKRDGINQYIDGIINNPRNVLNQLREVLKFVAGSKVENRFVIIFSLGKIYLFQFCRICFDT
jgi:hypothetical protein